MFSLSWWSNVISFSPIIDVFFSGYFLFLCLGYLSVSFRYRVWSSKNIRTPRNNDNYLGIWRRGSWFFQDLRRILILLFRSFFLPSQDLFNIFFAQEIANFLPDSYTIFSDVAEIFMVCTPIRLFFLFTRFFSFPWPPCTTKKLHLMA